MVVFDNSIFCLVLHPDARARSGVDSPRERVAFLLDSLREQKEAIILPAPAFAEFLILAGEDAPKYISKIRENSVFRIEPFDDRAAIETAQIEIEARKKGSKRGSADGEEWQKVKFDRQIVAIARVNNAKIIYSDDPDIAKHGKDCDVEVISLSSLPMPPSHQPKLPWETSNEQRAAEGPQATDAPSLEVRRSDLGRAEGQTGAEVEEE
jgi:predicted nucleic acid-binding protein